MGLQDVYLKMSCLFILRGIFLQKLNFLENDEHIFVLKS